MGVMKTKLMKGGTHMADTKLTPKALAEEIGIDAKVLRAYLRKTFTRDETVKNTSWIITQEAADAAREKFAKQETQTEAPAEA
jgi:predicted site-specific integrase-resolvase